MSTTNPQRSPEASECTIEGCGNKQHARKMCARHYRDWLAVKNGSRQCARTRCSSLAVLDGLCMRHYTQRKRTDELQELREARRCSVDGCVRPFDSNDLCQMHYQRLRKTGNPGPAARLRGANGKGTVSKTTGYRYIRGVAEHRLVMEDMLGRPLLREENVHHVNGDKLDNRPQNLELWNTSQPSGQRVDDKVAWAIELLMLYAPHRVNRSEMSQAKRALRVEYANWLSSR